MKLLARSRLCSVRLQEGSNNILLDNSAAPGPILYKSRSESDECNEPLVHLSDRHIHTNKNARILISDEEII